MQKDELKELMDDLKTLFHDLGKVQELASILGADNDFLNELMDALDCAVEECAEAMDSVSSAYEDLEEEEEDEDDDEVDPDREYEEWRDRRAEEEMAWAKERSQ